jgi:hypothetical protein
MPYETKEELLALATIDPELDAVSTAINLSYNHNTNYTLVPQSPPTT